jgi:predicted nucleic acid-binding protein
MRLLLDANILLDCLVVEASGLPRSGKMASDQLLTLCDTGVHQGLVAWHTLPILAYYYQRQHSEAETGRMIDALLLLLEVPGVTHGDALNWRKHAISDFEDALQMACAVAGGADILITRNGSDFARVALPVMTPEEFWRLIHRHCRQ